MFDVRVAFEQVVVGLGNGDVSIRRRAKDDRFGAQLLHHPPLRSHGQAVEGGGNGEGDWVFLRFVHKPSERYADFFTFYRDDAALAVAQLGRAADRSILGDGQLARRGGLERRHAVLEDRIKEVLIRRVVAQLQIPRNLFRMALHGVADQRGRGTVAPVDGIVVGGVKALVLRVEVQILRHRLAGRPGVLSGQVRRPLVEFPQRYRGPLGGLRGDLARRVVLRQHAAHRRAVGEAAAVGVKADVVLVGPVRLQRNDGGKVVLRGDRLAEDGLDVCLDGLVLVPDIIAV